MDPTLSLSFAVHSNPGVYALLLGSGISRSAAIPTGWEVAIDLVRKLAALKGTACDPDAETWFQDTFGEPPTYSGLLKRLCRTPAERQQLLRSYFEPSAEDEASGQKQPTKAHQSIAELVKSGHVRVILTTNFDRLLERNLEAAGVSPTIISTPNAVDGATPLTHAKCTVIKLHGDYLDARIKNTPEELEKYDGRINKLLGRVFDEFGLIVCGWSADWDAALVAAIARCKSRRFTTYWTTRGTASDAARRLIAHRAAETIPIIGADEFFAGLHQKVLALASFDSPHPLSARVAVAMVKRYVVDDRHRIELHDLVTAEVERVAAAISDEKMPVSGVVRPTNENIRHRLSEYETIASILMHVVATGCFWGQAIHEGLWRHALERLANRPSTGGVVFLIGLRSYPALLTLYAGGIAAAAAMNMTALRALLISTRVRSSRDETTEYPAFGILYAQAVMDTDQGRQVLEGMDRRHTPMSDYLFQRLREPLRDLLPSDDAYDLAFDRFEYFVALLVANRTLEASGEGGWMPIGRFGWKNARWGRSPVIAQVESEALTADFEWPPVKAGIFTTPERFKQAAAMVEQNIKQRSWF